MRLVVRIWLHAVLLFLALAALTLAVRFAMPHIPRSQLALWLHVAMLLAVSLVLALVFVALPLARSIARPLEQLGGLARALGAGDLTVRAPDSRRDEIGALGAAFNAMAGQLQQLRDAERQLLADVSHELRTPLARIRVVLGMADTADPAKLARYHAEIATDLSELEQLLNDIIAAARRDAGVAAQVTTAWPLRPRALELAELVDATTTRFRERWPNRELRCADPAPDAQLTGDPVLLRRALDNLVDNARKYSPDDTPIEITLVRNPDGWRIAVRDHGIGIAPADQPRVFTPFFRADPSRARTTGGVGLGLALTRRIVEAHGGTVGFTSELGRGSQFWLELPAA